jgi:hypothetical protein
MDAGGKTVRDTKNRSVRQKFTEALDELVEQVKGDRSVLAAILCGSLSHDTVWASPTSTWCS